MTSLDRNQARYLENPYCHSFTATVTQTTSHIGGCYAVQLDHTYFYPAGGGQEHDTGVIGGVRILNVFRDESSGQVVHLAVSEIPVGPVQCEIDWEPRLRNMQHHTGQHLLSQCILRLNDLKTVSANINGLTPSTLDIMSEKLLISPELDAIEDLANQKIVENLSVKTYFVNAEDVDNVPLRRHPKVKDNIRIVEIDGFDHSACGGTHCSRTGEIGIIKILKNERVNNKTRLHFVAGLQAMQVFRSYHQTCVNLSSRLSVNLQQLHNTTVQLIEDYQNQKKEIQLLQKQIISAEADKLLRRSEIVRQMRFIACAYQNRPVNELRTLADIIKNYEDTIALLASYDTMRLSIIVTCGSITHYNAKQLLATILPMIGGKGGGDSQIAQGGGAINADSGEALFEKAVQIARDIMMQDNYLE